MEVLNGVDPHKASLAVAAVDEATGELLELAAFPQDRAGLRSLERWARRFPERRWAVEPPETWNTSMALSSTHLPIGASSRNSLMWMPRIVTRAATRSFSLYKRHLGVGRMPPIRCT